MPRAVERTAAAIAGDVKPGWIRIPPPVSPAGWHEIISAHSQGAFIVFECKGRDAAYVPHQTDELWWAPVEPPADRWWERW